MVSLYPYINKTGQYPVGHPEMIISDFDDVKNYFGMVFCQVIPPEKLHFPVLPFTINGKLIFTLCMACAVSKNNDYCNHTDQERCLEGVWCTPELHHALDRGYKVHKIYEVWHWNHKRFGLFSEYVEKFLKEKVDASDWPSYATTPETRKQYLREVLERETVSLIPDRTEDNPARRAIAKIMLNSFWGKFGQRDNLEQTIFLYETKKYFDLCRSEAVEIHSVHAVSPECLMLTLSRREDYNEGNDCVNIAIAAFTTSLARLKLLDMLERLNDRDLYYDTDSVLFVHRSGDWLPQTGTFLGDWSNELLANESHITSFVSCGPEVYSYVTDTGRFELKVKGLTQNGYTEDLLDENLQRTGQKLDFEKLKKSLNGGIVSVTYPEFYKRDFKTLQISTVKMVKSLQKVYDKRVLWPDLTTVPFGTKRTVI
ncbi:uncharacterized protein LOC129595951 [Paramacrobiotus metropolitanus]|uniref:uncharacterized protein LOC129595951 n=1 Tax=Paramacrobiotus metropolitanus TaxID=2943436 RepID=UPI002445BE19|nr:uncharacterized protein LOC129595951 [Paramacrobiotus metropolitanus]